MCLTLTRSVQCILILLFVVAKGLIFPTCKLLERTCLLTILWRATILFPSRNNLDSVDEEISELEIITDIEEMAQSVSQCKLSTLLIFS